MAGQPISTLLIGLGGTGEWTALHVKRQLFDAYNNRLPHNVAIAVIDTDKNQRNSIGIGQSNRAEGMGIGKTQLDQSEYIHIGGDAFDLVKGVAAKPSDYPHLGWLLAERFLRDLPRASFFLEEGAGQFRQLGRLAVFRDVATPALSGIQSIVETKLIHLNRGLEGTNNPPPIGVIITGSLAGGTGAGTFIDLAHLVQRVAEVNNINITLRGFFLLPQAFQRTIDATQFEASKGRAFAALRELRRFLLNEDYQYGYPMHYQPPRAGVNERIWRGENKGKLFDFVYLVDGAGVNSVRVVNGAAPVIADSIMAFIDENYGPDRRGQDANVRKNVLDARSTVGRGAFVSTVGAYSIILPMQQIIESWAYAFATEMLLKIIPGKRFDRQGHMVEIEENGNPKFQAQKAIDEATRALKSTVGVMDRRGPNRGEIRPTSFWPRALDMREKAARNLPQALRVLDMQDLRDWLSMIAPSESESDPELRAARANTAKHIDATVSSWGIQTSNERRPAGDPRVDHSDIEMKARRFIEEQLGSVDSGGGRRGGEYSKSLDRFAELQIRRAQNFLTVYIMEELNNPSKDNPVEGKTGGLGWLIGVLTEMRAIFAENTETLQRLRTGQDNTFFRNRRAEVQQNMDAALKNMREKKDENRFVGEPPSIKAQKAYLQTVQEYIDFYRTDFARNSVAFVMTRTRDFLDQVIAELNIWVKVLGTQINSLHNSLRDGLGSIETDRGAASDVRNHRIINDKEWEDGRYQRYANEQIKQDFFKAWEWRTDLNTNSNTPRFTLGATLMGNELHKDIGVGQWAEENLGMVLEWCRDVFGDAVQSESALGYLMEREYPGNPAGLANELSRGGGYILNFQPHGMLLPSNILLAAFDEKNNDQRVYVKQVVTRLISNANRGGNERQDDPSFQPYQCADHFRITFLNTANLIQLETDIPAYAECRERYLATPFTTRQRDHIFGAEVKAVEYENRLPDLIASLPDLHDEGSRELSDRIALLLENEDLFIEFVFMLAYGVIGFADTSSKERNIQHYWRIHAVSPDQRRASQGTMEEWRLTTEQQNPSLMDAAIRYVLVGTDAANAGRRFRDIRPHLQKYRDYRIEEDTASRLDRDDLALDDPQLRGWLDAFLPPLDANGEEDYSRWTQKDDDERLMISQMVAIHDRLLEVYEYFRSSIPAQKQDADEARNKDTGGADAHNAVLLKQEEYDLYSIIAIALEEQINNYRDAVQRRWEEKTGSTHSTIGRF